MCMGRVLGGEPVNPSTPYAASKAAADMLLSIYLKQFGFPSSPCGRPTYGADNNSSKSFRDQSSTSNSARRSSSTVEAGDQVVHPHSRRLPGRTRDPGKGGIGRLSPLPDPGVAVREVVGAICERMGVPFEKAISAVEERPVRTRPMSSTRPGPGPNWLGPPRVRKGLSEVVTGSTPIGIDIKNQPA